MRNKDYKTMKIIVNKLLKHNLLAAGLDAVYHKEIFAENVNELCRLNKILDEEL